MDLKKFDLAHTNPCETCLRWDECNGVDADNCPLKGGKTMNLYYDEVEKVWKEHKEPFCTVECPTEADYTRLLEMADFWNEVGAGADRDRIRDMVYASKQVGKYVLWHNGIDTCVKYIDSVLICRDSIRYDLKEFAPIIQHPGILRIMTEEEARDELNKETANAEMQN